jgi:hypothetical protein
VIRRSIESGTGSLSTVIQAFQASVSSSGPLLCAMSLSAKPAMETVGKVVEEGRHVGKQGIPEWWLPLLHRGAILGHFASLGGGSLWRVDVSIEGQLVSEELEGRPGVQDRAKYSIEPGPGRATGHRPRDRERQVVRLLDEDAVTLSAAVIMFGIAAAARRPLRHPATLPSQGRSERREHGGVEARTEVASSSFICWDTRHVAL